MSSHPASTALPAHETGVALEVGAQTASNTVNWTRAATQEARLTVELDTEGVRAALHSIQDKQSRPLSDEGGLHFFHPDVFRRNITATLVGEALKDVTLTVKRESDQSYKAGFSLKPRIAKTKHSAEWHTGPCLSFTDAQTSRVLSSCIVKKRPASLFARVEFGSIGDLKPSGNSANTSTGSVTGQLHLLSVDYGYSDSLLGKEQTGSFGTRVYRRSGGTTSGKEFWTALKKPGERVRFWFGTQTDSSGPTRACEGSVDISLELWFVNEEGDAVAKAGSDHDGETDRQDVREDQQRVIEDAPTQNTASSG